MVWSDEAIDTRTIMHNLFLFPLLSELFVIIRVRLGCAVGLVGISCQLQYIFSPGGSTQSLKASVSSSRTVWQGQTLAVTGDRTFAPHCSLLCPSIHPPIHSTSPFTPNCNSFSSVHTGRVACCVTRNLYQHLSHTHTDTDTQTHKHTHTNREQQLDIRLSVFVNFSSAFHVTHHREYVCVCVPVPVPAHVCVCVCVCTCVLACIWVRLRSHPQGNTCYLGVPNIFLCIY